MRSWHKRCREASARDPHGVDTPNLKCEGLFAFNLGSAGVSTTSFRSNLSSSSERYGPLEGLARRVSADSESCHIQCGHLGVTGRKTVRENPLESGLPQKSSVDSRPREYFFSLLCGGPLDSRDARIALFRQSLIAQ